MSYTQQEVEALKAGVEEILDESFFSVLHELRKKLTILDSKLQEEKSRNDELFRKIEKLEKCHECHTTIVDWRQASTQVNSRELEEDEEPQRVKTEPQTDQPAHNAEPELICIDE